MVSAVPAVAAPTEGVTDVTVVVVVVVVLPLLLLAATTPGTVNAKAASAVRLAPPGAQTEAVTTTSVASVV
jgi:hypothetical protein